MFPKKYGNPMKNRRVNFCWFQYGQTALELALRLHYADAAAILLNQPNVNVMLLPYGYREFAISLHRQFVDYAYETMMLQRNIAIIEPCSNECNKTLQKRKGGRKK